MQCVRCWFQLPNEARFCPMCGGLVPQADPVMRRRLLDALLESVSSEYLSVWLGKLGQEQQGTDGTKRARIREHSGFLAMGADELPGQIVRHLERLDGEGLMFVCQKLGLPDRGTKRILLRRIVRHACARELWTPAEPRPVLQDLVSFFTYFLLLDPVHEERELLPEIEDELLDLFGDDQLFAHQPLAAGDGLSIDFHIGAPADGVGIEVVLLKTTSDCQRALEPSDRYLDHYGADRLLVVAVANDLSSAVRTRFAESLSAKGITHVFKRAM